MKGRFTLVAVVALVAVPSALADPARVGYPSSIASSGDSITRAFNTGFIPYIDAPQNSWTTGWGGSVLSHYRRILAANPLIFGRTFNNAVSGADAADLPGQAQSAVSQGAQYVTILMGANDACSSSEATMTPVTTFADHVRNALTILSTGLPDARIFVVSIPDIFILWDIYRTSSSARLVWTLAGICQSMLARPSSTAQADVDRRARVRQRVVDYNTQLAQICGTFIHCRFDQNAVFNTAFVRSDVTTRDYFHPSLAGQSKLAAGTWAATFDFTDQVAPVSSATVSAGAATLTATDNAGVAGLEYRFAASGPFTKYTVPVPLAPGSTLTYRAVDVNGNVEATKTVSG